MSTKSRTIVYWIATVLVAVGMVPGGVFDAIRAPQALAILSHLGYPAYFAVILGVWKVLGGIAVLAPGLPRLKEWAYAGMFFDLTGACLSHLSVGDSPTNIVAPLVLVVLVFVSWALRPPGRVLGVIGSAAAPGMART
jgi:uncharacterized membrane protein YphA (DoxX/SURF4 family)